VCDADPDWVQELKDFQRDGHSLEDLWKVAKGDIKYQDFVGSSLPRKGKQESHQAPAAPSIPEDLVRCQHCFWDKQLTTIACRHSLFPESCNACARPSSYICPVSTPYSKTQFIVCDDAAAPIKLQAYALQHNGAYVRLLCSSCLFDGHLNSLLRCQVGLQAYLMWEQAGKPDAANFSDDARRQLEQQVQSGKSVQDIEHALKGPSDQKAPEGHQPDHKVHTPKRNCDLQQWLKE